MFYSHNNILTMRTIIADLHIHSAYARSCSNKLHIEQIWKQCIIKWINLIWTWDFTHPSRMKEIEDFLIEDWNGFLIPKTQYIRPWIDSISGLLNNEVLTKLDNWWYPRFILQTEINNIFHRWEKKSRIHNCILIDSIEKAKIINRYFSASGNVESDGRLAVRKDQDETLIWLKKNFPESIFFPAHIWTPYFWVLWSRFWYESMKDAFKDALYLIDAIETWLSSDPIMNWINSELDCFAILSNSDAHSLENFGREWNIFVYHDEFEPKQSIENQINLWKYGNSCIWNITLKYKDLEMAIKRRKFEYCKNMLDNIEKNYLINLFSQKNNLELFQTIEFYPQEWKYFWNWHAKCRFISTPEDTIKRNWICPICWKNISIWVLHRSYNISNKDRIQDIGFGSKKELWKFAELDKIAKKFQRPSYRYIVPLRDIIREVWSANKGTKKAEKYYNELVKRFWWEFNVLIDIPIDDAKSYDQEFGFALEKVRNWDIFIKSWYDGNFWIVCIGDCDDDPIEQFNERFPNKWVQESLF